MTRAWRTLAVTMLAAGSLAFEILLVRQFAIQHFHHFAYMVIGVAMLGFGVSGTLLAALGRVEAAPAGRWFGWASVLSALFLVACPLWVRGIPLDPTQLAWDPGQWPRLAAVYALLALPFAAVALATLLALAVESERPGWIYGASFLGSGLGAALALGTLGLVPPDRSLAVPAIVAGIGAASACAGSPRSRATPWALLILAAAAWTLARPAGSLELSPYKALPQLEAYPGARRVTERFGPLGWVVAMDAPAFRYAPGLSLAFEGDLPPQTALLVDGEIAGAATAWPDERSARALLDGLPSSFAYALGGRERVLVIGSGGATEVWNAVVHGAERVVAVELQPDLVDLSRTLVPPPSGPDAHSEVDWVIGDARSYVARARGPFDLVALGPSGGFGSTAAGVYALDEDFLHTVEAYGAYLELLGSRGVLSVTRWLTIPPREIVRLVLTAFEALRRAGPASALDGVVVAHGWGTATVLVKPSGFSTAEVDSLKRWARSQRFDLDWYPGIRRPSAEFNLMEEPVLFHAAQAAFSGRDRATRFASAYPFDVEPATDARPYPHHFLRARSVGAFLSSPRGSWLPFAEWGYVAVLATLAQSVVLAAVFMVIPAMVRSRAGPHSPEERGRRFARLGYFAAIGLAYMAAEVAAIQQLGLLLGHPVYAVSAVLAAILICSGLGSAWSDRRSTATGLIAAAVLAIVFLGFAVRLLAVVHALQAAPLWARAAAAMLILAPVAFLMGTPFPTGLRSMAAGGSANLAWAWAANGFASVVAAPLAALIAIESGTPALWLLAASAYAAAALLGRAGRGRASTAVRRVALGAGVRE